MQSLDFATKETYTLCESKDCDQECALNSIYCLTHTCFPEKITHNNIFTDKQIMIQKIIERQLNSQKLHEERLANAKTQQERILANLSAPIGYITVEEGMKLYSIYKKLRENEVISYNNSILLSTQYVPVYEEEVFGDDFEFVHNINKGIMVLSECLFDRETHSDRGCVYCFNPAVNPLNICELHMPRELRSCIVKRQLQLNVNCYLTTLLNKILYMIMNYIYHP